MTSIREAVKITNLGDAINRLKKERDTYRDLCSELLAALKAQADLSNAGIMNAKEGQVKMVREMRHSSISKAESILGDKNGR